MMTRPFCGLQRAESGGTQFYNTLLEQPAMAKLLPGLTGKTVIDLGCGQNCLQFLWG